MAPCASAARAVCSVATYRNGLRGCARSERNWGWTGACAVGPHWAQERDEEQDLIDDAEVGVGAGAALGFLGGMLLFGIAAPGVGTLGAGGIVALGAASGFGGAMLGTFLGVAAAGEEFDEHQRLRETRLQPGEVLGVACGHDHPGLVESALQRHGGRLASLGG